MQSGGPGGSYSVGDAFSYGWQKFTEHWQPILLGFLIYAVAGGIISAIWFFIVGAIANFGGDAGFFAALIGAALFGLVALAVGFVIQAGVTRAALGIVDGRKPELSMFTDMTNIGPIIVVAILVGIGYALGSVLCYIPGLIFLFFMQFAVHFVVDGQKTGVDALRASYELIMQNVGPMLGLFVLSAVAMMVGSLVCGVGVLVAAPVVFVAQAYTFRYLQGRPIAA